MTQIHTKTTLLTENIHFNTFLSYEAVFLKSFLLFQLVPGTKSAGKKFSNEMVQEHVFWVFRYKVNFKKSNDFTKIGIPQKYSPFQKKLYFFEIILFNAAGILFFGKKEISLNPRFLTFLSLRNIKINFKILKF